MVGDPILQDAQKLIFNLDKKGNKNYPSKDNRHSHCKSCSLPELNWGTPLGMLSVQEHQTCLKQMRSFLLL